MEIGKGKSLLEKTENTVDGESDDDCETDKDANSSDSLKTIEG
jgi:hypothetical protein